MKILVVDDEQLVRWFLERTLSKGGVEVVTASDLEEALEKLDAGAFDLVIVDLRMPGGSGIELIEKAQGMTRKPKIVVCSAFVTQELEEKFRCRGICILKKPFKLQELNDALGDCGD
jgi:DNA-binding NtrC family response regulator